MLEGGSCQSLFVSTMMSGIFISEGKKEYRVKIVDTDPSWNGTEREKMYK